MLIRIGYEIIFDLPQQTAMTFLLFVLPSRTADLKHPDELKTDPVVPIEEFIDCFGNRCARLLSPVGKFRVWSDSVIQDPGIPEPAFEDAIQHPVDELPTDTLEFLLPSRYCEVDKLTDTAWKLFADTPPGWARAQAIRDWVHENVEFGYQYARPTKTACDVYEERKGVCRDVTHLSITFCRAMNIPARYATGYLGDIGVPLSDTPMDFSACFQVYLGGRWHTFDARHHERRIGWILMATGRDAADCAITTSYGNHLLDKFEVWTDEVQSPVLTERKMLIK